MFSQFHAQRVNVGPYCRYIYLIQKVSIHHGWRSAILPALERLPDEHGRLLQTPQGWKELLWCDDCNRGIFHLMICILQKRCNVMCCCSGSAHEGPQDDLVCLFSILQELVRAEPSKAPNHHPQGKERVEYLFVRNLSLWGYEGLDWPSVASDSGWFFY